MPHRVCHRCEAGLIAGTVQYDAESLEPPADESLLTLVARSREVMS